MRYTKEAIIKYFGLKNDETGGPVTNDDFYATVEDVCKMGAHILRLEERILKLELKKR